MPTLVERYRGCRCRYGVAPVVCKKVLARQAAGLLPSRAIAKFSALFEMIRSASTSG
jgi:hypothetical protein